MRCTYVRSFDEVRFDEVRVRQEILTRRTHVRPFGEVSLC